mmetsp:Transcript_6359/g.25868  ORF Transcript_6359/g.25868 Transcript_6359/m.25868 type:complete len:226 (+) Transcript_6359:1443-2120(+)
MLKQMCKPRPVPPRPMRVVKKGSKTRPWCSGRTPTPLSRTTICTWPASSPWASTQMRASARPSKPCSSAFCTRLVSTWPRGPGKLSMTRPAAAVTSSWHLALLNEGRSVRQISWITWSSWNWRRCELCRSTATCLKLEIRSAARWRLRCTSSAAAAISSSWSARALRVMPCSTQWRSRPLASDTVLAASRLLPIGVLSSWATPATIAPSAASFSLETSSSLAALS